ncbi:hypothetical protein AB0K09_09265 [Streptomyces sp. NPDC049577]|uniref:hypothetical protein n=1 Tax=Streptomyces sp. NPDC049577 TaxID=3155153 RepID=UPI00342FEC57
MNDSAPPCPGSQRYPELGQHMPVHRRTALHRTIGALLLLLGCGLLGTALWLLPALTGAVVEAQEFRRAVPCPTGEKGVGTDCVERIPAAVVRVHMARGKHDSSYADLAEGTARPYRVNLYEDAGTAGHWRPGDRATVSVWHGRIVAVTVDGRRVRTGDVWNEDRLLGMAVLVCLTVGGTCALYGFFRLRPAPGPACEPDPRADALHPVWITALCWTVPAAIVTDALDLPIEDTVPFWTAGLLFAVRAAGRAVYRARAGAHPDRDPASVSPRLDRLFGAEGLLLPARRQEFRKESEALAQGRRIEFHGTIAGYRWFAPSPVAVLALENGSLYASPARFLDARARHVPLEGYRLTGIRLPHLTPSGRGGKRAHPRTWQAAELEGPGGRLTIVTDPVRLRLLLGVLRLLESPATGARPEAAAGSSR